MRGLCNLPVRQDCSPGKYEREVGMVWVVVLSHADLNIPEVFFSRRIAVDQDRPTTTYRRCTRITLSNSKYHVSCRLHRVNDWLILNFASCVICRARVVYISGTTCDLFIAVQQRINSNFKQFPPMNSCSFQGDTSWRIRPTMCCTIVVAVDQTKVTCWCCT